jgi:GT2 family glycosyltransferase/glycosyltransferase involved in cell wall biosynthesis/2-polyprenyl-3-methyl-5-hydroxy-6-metoxy-1,4-benzoquinol methylase
MNSPSHSSSPNDCSPSTPRHAEDLLATLIGKRVAVVGNATPKREFGHLIDGYDAVIRLNNFRIAGFEKLVGRRTDFRCTTGFSDIEHRNEHPEFSPFSASAVESAHLEAFNRANASPVLAARLDVHPFIPETPKPSAGFALVELARQAGLPIDLFGFDGFKTAHYWRPGAEVHTTHSAGEFQAILQRPNVILFGETYPYAELYDFCHANHRDYDHNVGLELTRRLSRQFRGKTIIEFGAGNGDLSHHLEAQGNLVTAIEVSGHAFAKIHCSNKIHGDAFTLAGLREGFDVFASVDVLEHLTENDIRLVLREAGRLTDYLYLSVSTRPSGLLGPKGENLHLTVKPPEWWVEQVGRYFDVHLSNGYGAGQIVLEGARKGDRVAPEIAGAGKASVPPHYHLKNGYRSRPKPEYFEDTVTEEDGIVWQPNVYPFAAAIARHLKCERIIDLGCGHAQKLTQLRGEFDTVGFDFGSNLAFCRARYPEAKWFEADFENRAALGFPPDQAENSVLICSDVIEHMISPEALLGKAHELLEQAKVAVISTPERDLTWGAEHAGPPPNPCHTREWNLGEFCQLLRSAGLTVEYAGLTRSHDRDPARKTILAVVRRGEGDPALQNWLAVLNHDSAAAPFTPSQAKGGDSRSGAPSPLVSVIVPTYNRLEWLRETLQSILAQTYRQFEIVVVNDAGPDISPVVAGLNAEGKIRVIAHSENKGLGAARNTGVRAARGKYIAYLDDDDIFLPNHLATLVSHLETTRGKVSYTDAHRATQKKENGAYVIVSRDVPYSNDWDNERILVQNFVPVLCFMHEKRCIEEAGWFDESLTTHEDWDLWIRMSRLFRFKHIAEITCEFRWREDGSSMSSKSRMDFLRTSDLIYKKSVASAAGRHDLAWRRQQHLLAVSHSIGEVAGKPTPDCILVSIVIPVFNRLELTRACIEAIHRETRAGSFEIIVIDNASTDGTAEYLEAEEAAGRLRVIRNESNLGYGKGCNQGIAAARGGFILLLNNDTVPLAGWLDALLTELLIHSRAAAAGSCLLYPGGEVIQHAGVTIGAGEGRIHPYYRWRLQRLDKVPQAEISSDCRVVTGACLLLRKAALDEVGVFDEGFINGFEDVDLCFRLAQAGYGIRYCANSRVIHHESMTTGRKLHDLANFYRLNERWKSIITPEESIESTRLNLLEIQCRERLLTEPGNPIAIAEVVKSCQTRGDLEQAKEWEKKLLEATSGGQTIPISVSIVIPVMNKLALTRGCLAALERSGGLTAHEIIVVDNASDDGTAEYLRELERNGKVRVIRNSTNLGFARGCNQGALMARGKFTLFLNNDTVAVPGWLDAMVVAAHRPDVGVVGAKLLYENNTIQHAGIGWVNGLPDHPWRHASSFAPEVNAFRELDMVTGACFLIYRDLFLELGGFDEVYRNGVEDIDLCLRVRSAGRKVVYEPGAVVYHLEGQTAGRFNHVSENLNIFFERWGNRFDAEKKLIPASSAEKIRASRGLLVETEDGAANAEVTESAPIRVSWEGSFLDYGSLSHVNRELCRQLQSQREMDLHLVNTAAAGASAAGLEAFAKNVSVRPPENADITIRHAWPPNWQRPASGKLVVIQMWEFGSLPERWVEQARNADEFWVPSRFVEKTYLESGIPESKIKVVPLGMDAEMFHANVPPRTLPTKKKFKFLFVGGTILRKGPDLLLSAYLKSFTAADDVCLVVKDFGGQSVYKGQTFSEQIKAAQAEPNAPEILYLDAELAPEEIPGLYTACDCLVHPYRGEGFGLPVLEAMACGLPVLVTAGGATDDFATDTVAYRLPSTRRNLGRQIGELTLVSDGWFLEPNLAALAEQMKWVAANPEESRATGRRASEQVRAEWTWKNAGEIAAKRLRALATQPSVNERTSSEVSRAETQPSCAQIGSLAKARELFGHKKYAEAWSSALTAIALRPFHPEAFMLLAEIAVAVRGGQIARQCAQRARELVPGWKAPKKFLQQALNFNSAPEWLKLPSLESGEARAEPRLSVCVITKNEERFIDQCLKSIRAIATQIVVVDTGSTDRTIEIARSHEAEVWPLEWSDDFSAARNAALAHATGDWVLILDADEELPAEQHANLRNDLKYGNALACRLPLVNQGQEGGRCFVPRLFRNAPGLHFSGRVHEQVFTSLIPHCKQWGMETRLGTAQLLHHGYSEEVIKERSKAERNLRLLTRAVAEMPKEPNLFLNLGLELVRSGRPAEALGRYRQAFQLVSSKAPSELLPEFREGLFTQYTAQLYQQRQYEEVLRILNTPLAKSGGLTASLHFAAALAHYELKQYREAATHLRQCLAKRGEPTLSPINTDILTAAPAHCLALALALSGDMKGAQAAFESALKEKRGVEKVKLDYAKFLAGEDRAVEALQTLYELIGENSTDLAAWKLGGQIALGRPEMLEFAMDWTSEAIKYLSESKEILALRAEALLLSGDAVQSLGFYERAGSKEPSRQAGLIACQIIAGQRPACVALKEEQPISQEFLRIYRRLLARNDGNTIREINEHLDLLDPVLPLVTDMLRAVLAEADDPRETVACA